MQKGERTRAKILSILGGALIFVGLFQALVVVLVNWLASSPLALSMLFLGILLDVVCGLILLFADEGKRMLIAGTIGLVSSIAFVGGIFGLIGGILGIIGGILKLGVSTKTIFTVLMRLSPFLAFLIPSAILYVLYPNSFEPTLTGTWENRVGYILFLWLFSLETILSWEELRTREFKLKSIKTIVFIMALLLPTTYVIISNCFGLNTLIIDLAKQYNIKPGWAELMPLSMEYLVFAVLFALIIFLEQGRSGLKNYSISMSFLVIIGTIYIINNAYPFGKFTPFQLLVHPTTILAANILNLMGYRTTISFIDNHPVYGSLTNLGISDSHGNSAQFGIAWPCAGVESLLVYTVTILLFLKKSAIPLNHKIIYFIIGAIVTYFINILRIVSVFVIAINKGDWGMFHDYYGQFYSLTWIISYPLIIIGSQALWNKIRNWKKGTKDGSNLLNQTRLPS